MAFYDIFNGDADGICALQQLRLHEPRDSRLVTGAKRDISLLRQVQASAGDELTVLDISMAENREALLAQLHAGARCIYFDHHFPGDVPTHPNLETHLRYAAGTCTSLIVNGYLNGQFCAWAVVGAYGDNLRIEAEQAAASLNLPSAARAQLRALGECLNYNAYGDTLADLHFHPAELFGRLHAFADPLEFVARDSAFQELRQNYEADMALASALSPFLWTATHYLALMPDAPWSRRVHGPWANRLADEYPARAHAVLIEREGSYRVSVRAPVAHPGGADALCRQFVSGGGRPAAAGINSLPTQLLGKFIAAFEAAFGTGA